MIEAIQAGDKVLSYDLLDEAWKERTVLSTHSHEHVGKFVTVRVAGDAIESTFHHPYWVVAGEDLDNRPQPDHVPAVTNAQRATPGRWVDAGDLKVADLLLLRSGSHAPIEEISLESKTDMVYNIQVEDLHNYAVGHAAVLVHNNSGGFLTVANGDAAAHITINGSLAEVEFAFLNRVTPSFVKSLFEVAKANGARSALVNSGPVINTDIAIKLGLLSQDGGTLFGGTVTLVSGGTSPIFVILFPIL